jgi:hypothetical protein
MRNLALSVLFFSLPAFSATQKEVTHAYTTARVANVLRCVVIPGNNATFENSAYTELNSKESFLHIMDENNKEIGLSFEHPELTASGCNLKNLNKISDSSLSFFGFAQGAPVTLTREKEQSFINGFNECVAVFHETIETNISKAFQVDGENQDLQDLVLTSKISRLIKANDCNQ